MFSEEINSNYNQDVSIDIENDIGSEEEVVGLVNQESNICENTIDSNAMNVKIESEEINVNSLKNFVKIEKDSLMSNLSKSPSQKDQENDDDNEDDIIVENTKRINSIDISEKNINQEFTKINSTNTKNSKIPNNYYSKSSEYIKNKCRSKSERIKRELHELENPIRNIQIKEGDFCSDLHKSYNNTNSINEKVKKNQMTDRSNTSSKIIQNASNKTVPRQTPKVIFLPSKSELKFTPNHMKKKSFSNSDSK